MFSKVLIANRGEIAVRIMHACRERGLATVAVYSDADAGALHVRLADEVVRIGPGPAQDSYLSVDALMAAARHSGADAIHPGYGFLSERSTLARACEQHGIVFIGPPPAALDIMGSKIAARHLALGAGVPLVPGAVPRDQSDAALLAAADAVGFPLLLKPSAGGGGIGMKVVRTREDLADAVTAARRDGLAAFGSGDLYVERLIERPRHVEVHVLADHHGHVVHLFERECSVQRRHQKVLEESPSPTVTPGLRQRMGEAAVALARAAAYRNAGTVEFLVEGAGEEARFYFLEMNTRLQVEHPVTEQVTGVDLVHLQLDIAAGIAQPWTSEGLAQRGHAIEARVYAEDPAHEDLPQAGPLLVYRTPQMPGVRVDSGYGEGDLVSVHYDPLLAKVIATAPTRELARLRLMRALETFVVLGIRTNVAFLLEVLRHPDYAGGTMDTGWLDREGTRLRAASAPAPDAAILAVAEAVRTKAPAGGAAGTRDPWEALSHRRV
jgi:acetyl/propionyl-CoA carboxylase alpha subunit